MPYFDEAYEGKRAAKGQQKEGENRPCFVPVLSLFLPPISPLPCPAFLLIG